MSNTKLHHVLIFSAAGLLAGPACRLDPPAPVQLADAGAGASCQADADGYPNHKGVDGGAPAEGASFAPVACTQDNSKAALALFSYLEPYAPDPASLTRAQQIAASMTLSELADQMRGTPFESVNSPQYKDTQRSLDTSSVRGYRYRDASRGVNFGEDMRGSKPNAIDPTTGKPSGVGYATVFPASMARGAAFDLDLEYAIGEAIGDEMQAAGESLLLAPCMNVLRHPLWGRAQETYGEDPFHIGRLSTAMTIGIQRHITANAKHYLGYNIENNRQSNNAIIEERALREIYGRHFRMVVQDGGVASVMASYNLVNGLKSTQNSHTLTDVLRNDFGFQGFVLSDWWAMPNNNFTSTDPTRLKAAAIEAVQAGLDVELPWSFNLGQLESIVESNGQLKKQDIVNSAIRVLLQKDRFNSINKGNTCGLGSPITTYRKGAIGGCDVVHINLARRAAVESMVLLKNDNSVLPINSSVRKVAVVGAIVDYVADDGQGSTGGKINFATDTVTGDKGSSRVFHDPSKGVGPFAGIDKFKPSGEINVVHGSTLNEVGTDADFYVVVAGLTPQDEGEEYTKAGDRKNFVLDGKTGTGVQNSLIQQVASLKKPMVVVLEGGSVIDMSSWLDQVPAVVMAWYPGMVGGDAMGLLLWGETNFAGKLPLTWGNPSQYGELAGTSETVNDFFFGYREFDKNNKTPVYPFGHGLSYTKFEYGSTQLGCTSMTKGAVLPVTVSVKNTGGMDGDEIVMVFASFPDSAVPRGPKELKGFARVSLKAGEEKQVTIPLRLKDLDYFQVTDANNRKGQWVVESGNVDIWVGGSYTTLNKVGSVPVTGYASESSKDEP